MGAGLGAPTIPVLVADARPLVQRGLCLELEEARDLRVVATARSLAEAITSASRLRPKVAVIAVDSGAGLGISGCHRILEASAAAVVVVAPWDLGAFVASAWRIGASACVSEREQPGVLVESVRQAAAGGRCFSPVQISRSLAWFRAVQGVLDRLSAREFEILPRIAAGRTNREIASSLSICEHTVEFHVNGIFTKLGLSSRRDVVVWLAETHALACGAGLRSRPAEPLPGKSWGKATGSFRGFGAYDRGG